MYRLTMAGIRRIMLLIAAGVCFAALAACGSDSDAAVESAATSDAADPTDDLSNESSDDEDHGDHDDEDHDDDDHDHDDDDHDDDDHGDDHDDEDHDDEDHDDEDHGDHDDEDHDDEDHGDHDDEDHGDDHDEDHDDDHDDDASSGLGAHVHGEAELTVAWSEGDVVIDLISPTDNVFGFEYEPTTDEDVAFADAQTQALTAPGLLVFNPEADCSLTGDPVTDVVFEGSHAEITASWFFACNNPDQISELDAGTLFAEFPGFVDIDAQWASETRQSAAELSASSTVLRFG